MNPQNISACTDSCGLGIQYSLGRSISSAWRAIPNVSITEWWFCRISSLDIAVRLYVGFPALVLISSSSIKTFALSPDRKGFESKLGQDQVFRCIYNGRVMILKCDSDSMTASS